MQSTYEKYKLLSSSESIKRPYILRGIVGFQRVTGSIEGIDFENSQSWFT